MKVFRAVIEIVTTEFEIREITDALPRDAKLAFLAGLGKVITEDRYVEKRTRKVVATWVSDYQPDPHTEE